MSSPSHKPFLFHRRQIIRSAALVSLASPLLGLGVRLARAQPGGRSQLRIGFQKGTINLALLKLTAGLERRLPQLSVSWVEFPAGPQILEALSVGSVDLGATGDSPPVFAQAAGKDLVYVGAESPKPDSSAILVKPQAPLHSLKDLKGRRVAFQKGSSAHYLVVQAVAKAGLQWADIQPVYLAPADARAAFERGAVDAWAIWDPYYAAAEIDSQVRVLTTSRGLTSNNTFYLATRSLASDDLILQSVLASLVEVDRYLQQNRQEAAKRFAEYSGLGLATVLRVLERRQPSPVSPLSSALIAEQQKVADAFADLKLIPRPIRVAEALPNVQRLAVGARP